MKLSELHQLARVVAEDGDSGDPKRKQEIIQSIGMDPNTFYQELEMTSHLVDTHRDVSYSNAHIQLHSHAFYELIFCRNTCGAEYLIGSERYRLMRGDVIFIPPGVSHRPILPEEVTEPYKRYVVWMSPEFMEQYAVLYSQSLSETQSYPNMLRTGGTSWHDKLVEMFRMGVEEFEHQEEGWEAAVIGNTITLLTQIRRATNERSAFTIEVEKPELLDRIMEHVEKNYDTNITIGDVAEAFFVSASTVSHLFKQRMGISFYHYVTQRRLIEAKKLIERDVLLEHVAGQVGFEDYSGFYRAFKKEYGISPRKYRNLLN